MAMLTLLWILVVLLKKAHPESMTKAQSLNSLIQKWKSFQWCTPNFIDLILKSKKKNIIVVIRKLFMDYCKYGSSEDEQQFRRKNLWAHFRIEIIFFNENFVFSKTGTYYCIHIDKDTNENNNLFSEHSELQGTNNKAKKQIWNICLLGSCENLCFIFLQFWAESKKYWSFHEKSYKTE